MKARHKRFGFLVVALVGLGLASWLVLNALDNYKVRLGLKLI